METHLVKQHSANPSSLHGADATETDALGIGTWTWQPLEDRLIWSSGVFRLLQLPPEHTARWDLWLNHVHPEDEDRVRRTFNTRPCSGGNTLVLSYRMIRNDGSLMWIEDRRRMDEGGLCQGAFIDVTQTRMSCNDSDFEALTHRSVEAAGIGVFFRDFVRGKDYWNDALFEICGLPKSITPPHCDQLLPVHHLDDADTVRRHVAHSRLTGAPLWMEYRIRTPAGEERWLREHGRHLKGSDGQLRSYCGVVENITQEKLRIQQLEKNRQFLNLVLNSNNMAVWEWNRKSGSQFWSDEFSRLIGCDPGEVTPSHEAWVAALHPDDRDWVADFSANVGNGEVHALTYRVLVGGTVRWIRESWKDVMLDDGTDAGATIRRGVSADVTDWKERENAFRVTDNWLRLAVDGGRIGLWSHDTQTNKYQWNDYAYQLLGYSPGEVEPSEFAWNSRIHPEDIARVKSEVAKVRSDGAEITIEYRVVLPNQSERWLEERGTRDAMSRMRHGILLDITARKTLQHQIESGRQRLQLALDTGRMGFWTGHGGEEEWDERTYKLLGYEPNSVKPGFESFLQALQPEDRRVVQDSEETRVRSGELISDEYRIVHPDGTERWIESTRRLASPGTPERYGVIVDITERKSREEFNLRSERLQAAGKLLGGLAHDFNNFLAIISVTLESLTDLVRGTEAVTRVSEARHATAAAMLFNRRLINISKERIWQPRIVSLCTLISDIITVVRPIVKKEVEISVQFPTDLWKVEIDPIECECAIINLLINARDAITSSGFIDVSAKNLQTEDAADPSSVKHYVVISVCDSGRGMDKETLRMSTEPFFTTKAAGAGTGLGLSSVASFATSAGGYMSLESAPEAGTTVSIYLPRAIEPLRASVEVDSLKDIPLGQGELVLIVDDDEHVREIVMQRVEALGYAVEEAADAVAALDVLQTNGTFDLVLSDVTMPGPMNGLDLQQRLERDMPHLPLVLITAYEQIVGDAGSVRILSKSCSQKDLAQALAAALASRR